MPTYLTIATHAPLDLDTVLLIEAEGKQVHFYKADERISAPLTFAEALALLPAEQFVRVHKRYAINFAHIHKIEPEQVLVGDQLPVPLSPAYREALLARRR
jgi:two-component system, LytTR family, response regulator